MAKSEEEQKSLLMRVKEKSDKACFKLNMQKTKIMLSGPIISWQIEGVKVYVVTDIFLGSKITMDSECRHEIKRCLFLGRKVMTNLDNVLRSRDINLPRKTCVVKTMFFLVFMYGFESWTIKKAEHWRIYAFLFWWWRHFLKVLWTPRRSNQSSPKEVNLEYSLEGLMLKLQLQYFDYLMWRTNSRKYSDAGKDWRQEKGMTEDKQVGWLTQWTWIWANSGRQWKTEKPVVLQTIGSQRVGHDLVIEQ